MTIKELLSTISDLGVIGLMITAFYGGAKQMWVWGWSYREKVAELNKLLDEAKQDRDEWKDLALKGTDIAARVAAVAEQRTVR